MEDWAEAATTSALAAVTESVVEDGPQAVLLLLAFSFTATAFLLVFLAFEYIYTRMTGNDLLNSFFERDTSELDRIYDEMEQLKRQREREVEELARARAEGRPPRLVDELGLELEPPDEEDLMSREAEYENKLTRIKLVWLARRQHLLKKQQIMRGSICIGLALLLFWRAGAMESRWCSLSATHRQLVHSLLAHTTAVLNSNGITHWLDGHTLLSVRRDGKLSEWDDRLVLGVFKADKPKIWNTLRPALEQKGRYYLEKYQPPVMASSNPPAFRLHYATLQRHFSKLPYLDIYLYERSDAGSDTPAETADKEVEAVPRVKEDTVLPLRNVTVIDASLSYTVTLPNSPSFFIARIRGEEKDSRDKEGDATGLDDERTHRGYKALTCYLYRDSGHNMGVFAVMATLLYFALVVYALPRVSFNPLWRF